MEQSESNQFGLLPSASWRNSSESLANFHVRLTFWSPHPPFPFFISHTVLISHSLPYTCFYHAKVVSKDAKRPAKGGKAMNLNSLKSAYQVCSPRSERKALSTLCEQYTASFPSRSLPYQTIASHIPTFHLTAVSLSSVMPLLWGICAC
jgi:hypothetical protein